jgi:N-acetylmuramoyl-L-alanine amidase
MYSMKKILFFVVLCILLESPLFAQTEGINIVVIDPGHGGYDFGIRTSKLKEKDITLSIARQMESILRGEGKKVFVTRKFDQYLSIAERLSRANRKSPDVFLSLHLSDSDGFAVYVTWYEETEAELTLKQYYFLSSRQRRYLYESRALATIMEDTLKREFGVNVVHREMPLPILNSIGAPALLIEMPSKGIEYDEAMRFRMAYAIVIGILLYEQR